MKKFQGYRSRVLFKGTLEHNEFIRIITFKPKKKLKHVPQYWSNKEFSRVSFKGTLQGYRSMVPFKGTVQGYRSRVPFKGIVQWYSSMVPFNCTVQGYRSRVPFKGTLQGYRSRVTWNYTCSHSKREKYKHKNERIKIMKEKRIWWEKNKKGKRTGVNKKKNRGGGKRLEMNGSEKQKMKNQEYKRTGFNAGELGKRIWGENVER